VQKHHNVKKKQDFVFDFWKLLKEQMKPVLNDQITFEDLNKFLVHKAHIELVAKFLAIIKSFVSQNELEKGALTAEIKQARIMLSSLMIIKFPQDILDVTDVKELDPLGEKCYSNAKDMIHEIFEQDDMKTSLECNRLKCENSLKTINDFIESFQQWQTKDINNVVLVLSNYYEQWIKSRKVLSNSPLNEFQKQEILVTLNASVEKTVTRMKTLVGIDKTKEICNNIDRKVEQIHIDALSDFESNLQARSNGKEKEINIKEESKEVSVDEKLASYGVPSKLKTGVNLLHSDSLKQEKKV